MGVCCSKSAGNQNQVNNIKKNIDNSIHNPLPKTIDNKTTKAVISTTKQQYTRDDILFINYDDLKKLTELPRYPDYCVNANTIDRSKAMFIYVAHNWLRSSATPGWMTKNHPDNAKHEKFQLILKGIEKLKLLAPGFKEVYIWIDYSCINQTVDPALELVHLDKIITACDLLFTPIVDDEYDKWTFPRIVNDWYTQYKAKSWNEGEGALLNRSWCRLEMIYSANILLQEDSKTRENNFTSGLFHAIKTNRRPHYIYGHKEFHDGIAPIGLPPFMTSIPDEYDPLVNSFITKKEDLIVIEKLLAALKCYLNDINNKPKLGYAGERNATGQRHGKGTELFQNGNIFIGDWENGKMCGQGTLKYSNGNVYEGDWKENKMHGQGTLKYSNGNIYVGSFIENQMNGPGVLTFSNGNIVEANFENGKYYRGTLTFKNGRVYNGEFSSDGKMNGQGELKFDTDDIFEGTFLDDKIHSPGKLICKNTVYIGELKDGKKHGSGELLFPNNDQYSGNFVEGKMHGNGVYKYVNGDEYNGEWKNDRKDGVGTLKYSSGDIYVGGFMNNEKHGQGSYTYSDGRVVKGMFQYGEII